MNLQQITHLGIAIIFPLPIFWFTGSSVLAQTDSTWLASPNSTDWFDPLNWNNGIPNAAGDIARVPGAVGTATLDLSTQATVGQINLFGFGDVLFQGTGPLIFNNPGADPAVLRTVVSRAGTTDAEISTPLQIASGESLLLDLVARKTLHLSGSIESAEGDITKTGLGSLTVSSDNSAWGGTLTIDEGELILSDVNALANSSNVSVGPNSSLIFVPQDVTGQRGDNYRIPSVSIDGGIIQTRHDETRNTATSIETDLHLIANSSFLLEPSDVIYLYGDIDGAGGLNFQRGVAPPADEVTPYYPRISILGDTSYFGETIIGPGTYVAFRRSDALGNGSAGTLVDRGTLELRAGGGNEVIEIRQGRLNLFGAVDAYGHNVFLDQGQLFGGDDDGLAATLNATPLYSGGVALGTASGADNLVLAEGISGTGTVFSLNEVEIAGELSARGHYVATSRGPARLSGKLSQAGDVYVSDTQLVIAGDLESPQGTFFIYPDFTVSRLVIGHSNTLESIVIDPRNAERTSFQERFRLDISDGAELTITDELRFFGGTITGAIKGQSVIAKKDRTVGVLEDIRGSEFTRIDVEGGQLTLRGDAGEMPPTIHLISDSNATLIVDNAAEYGGDIFLNNAQGLGQQGALQVSGNTVLAGNIFLGDLGSSLSTILSSAELADITGVVHGGVLTLKGRQEIRLRSSNHTYTGDTHVFAENFRLVDGGRLNSTSNIVGTGRIGTGGGRAGLVLDNSGIEANNDRIPDVTPVHLNGMKLTLVGREGEQVTEFLGTLYATRGMSEIAIDNLEATKSETELVIGTLNRQPGGALRFDLGHNAGQVKLVTEPTLDNGIIGGWAVVRGYGFSTDQDFATYGPNGVVAYSDLHTYATDLPGATASDNVDLLSKQVSLSDDKNINALRVRDSDIDLDGNTLTLESGGLIFQKFGDTISNGQLTAGTATNAELLVSGIGTIEADIVDNPQGAVGLTYASNSGSLLLSGNNTYTGPTVFSAGNGSTAELLNETALPSETDLTVSGTDLRIAYSSTNPIELGHLELRDNGLIRPTESNPPSLQPTSIHLESGEISGLNIMGDVPITKTTDGIASLGRSLTNHTGSIEIERGLLIVDALGPAPLDNDHAVTVRRGGIFVTSSDLVISNRKFRLDGGILDIDLRGGLSTTLEVLAAGGFLRNELGTTTISSPITGQGPLVVEGGVGNGLIIFEPNLDDFQGTLRFTGGSTAMRGSNPNYSQSVEIAASKFSVSGDDAFGTSEVTILPEGRMDLSGTLMADLTLAGGALGLAPGDSPESLRLGGQLSITEDSYIYIWPIPNNRRLAPLIESTVILSDRKNLNISPDIALQPDGVAANLNLYQLQEQISLSGDIIVNGNSTLTSFDASVKITGVIRPGVEDATLNLEGNDTFDLLGSIQIDEGKSLSVTIDGDQLPLALSNSDNRLTGSGSYIGDIEVHQGAVIAPGNSHGELTIKGDLTFGEGSVYEWEIASIDGAPGEAWDLLHVEGDLQFTGTEELPWKLSIRDLPGFTPRQAQPWLIASATSITGLDTAEVEFDLSEVIDVWPSLTPDHLSLYTQSGNLYLKAVPEPNSLLLVVLGMLPLTFMWQRA